MGLHPAMQEVLQSHAHTAVFYQTATDLLQFQVPFFSDGLRAGAAAVWLVRSPLTIQIAQSELSTMLPDLGLRMQRGQIQILDGESQYAGEAFEPVKAASYWEEEHARVRSLGYSELRITGNINGPIEDGTWALLMEYERRADELIHSYSIRSLCCYESTHLNIANILDVANHHELAFVKRNGEYDMVRNEEYQRAADAQACLAQQLLRRAEQVEQLLSSERHARAEAERANRLKDEFLATISHELRTPLNAILGWSQLLESTPSPTQEDFQEGLDAITRNAKTQTQLIEDLLDMSRINSGKLRLNPRIVNPTDLVQAAIDTLMPSAEDKGLLLQSFLDEAAGSVEVDPDRLQQIVWNLLSNAIKFTPANGRIDVRLERVDETIEISVSDTGAGISPEFLPYIFERFSQADASTTRKYKGLGLGLSIVKHLVEMHNGAVDVESRGLGKGATFKVKLPLHLPEKSGPASSEIRARPQEEIQLEGIRVLAIDDEPDSLEIVSRLLKERKAVVYCASSMREALGMLGREKIDVILSDISMPEGDGYELMQHIRSLEDVALRNLPAAAVTAFNRPEDKERVLGAGYQMHIAKPIEPSLLVWVVAQLAGLN